MEIDLLNLRNSINKAYLKVKPNRTQIETFKKNITNLFDQIKESESEEFHKNIISEFLKNTYYSPYNYINTKGRSDLVIHNGKDSNSTVGVLFEAKKPSNKSEMPTCENINTKAFYELILYYLRERIINKNIEVKHLVITNIVEWFIFNASDFERLFANDKSFVKQFTDFEEGRLPGTNTDFFYKNIAELFVNKLESKISVTYFDIRDFESTIKDANREDDNKLIALYKILSPEHLLKLPFANDSNNLDKTFYNELLHIIGLEETKEGSKKLIGRKIEKKRNPGSLIENAITILKYEDCLSQLPKLSDYGNNKEEQLFNISLELVITWINRILFLKLLEGQLIKYNNGDKAFRFLNVERIHDYDELNKLFFQVLAVKENDRSDLIKQKFSNIPYLNSSLFEPGDLEHKTIRINSLDDHSKLPVLSGTVLKDKTGKKLTGEIDPLQYLFEFLDSYDFSSEGSEDIQEETKTLINASVLGLIFEKINGYKDGSFFTPGFITMYMCHETIRRAVVQKFNEAKGWQCETISDVYNKIENIKEADRIINSIRICDPAVGSGHFLVSALNEIIAIKSELKILTDREGKKFKEYTIEVINDDLIITNEQSKLFEYNPKSKESQRVQEALFQEKQKIIENCLFGVDINPNSVKICRLRLWIELLKNAYYKPDTNYRELETLPNIDINIKCGNSLISRYPLDADIKTALKSSKWDVDNYREAVMTYRNAQSKDEKRSMEQLIGKIKNDFETEVSKSDKRFLKLNKLNGELLSLTGQSSLFELTKTQKDEWNKKVKKLTEEIKKYETEMEEIKSNKIYENAFEWRFEFPEVLNNDGDFVGFDVVIGNPPYGISIKNQARVFLEKDIGKIPDFEIYYWFINKGNSILKQSGQFSYIIPNTLLFNIYAQNYRISLFDKWHFEELLDCTDFNIFHDATVRNIILMLKKEDNGDKIKYRSTKNITSFYDLINNPQITINKEVAIINNQNWGLIFKLDQTIIQLISKIKLFKPLSDFFNVSQGYIPYRTSDLIKIHGKEKGEKITKERLWHSNKKLNNEYKQEIFGRDIKKYSYTKSESYVWYGKHLACYVNPKFFNTKRILVREITNPTIIACLIEEEFVNDPQLINIIKKSERNCSLKYLWAILNSKLATFYHFNSSPKATKGVFPKILIYDVNNFPIPVKDDKIIENQLVNHVNYIFNKKKQDTTFNTNSIEAEIDRLVYELYGLTEEEIKIVEEAV
ncbi:MAG TPA: TaqI-like C-terminal specificity domain-containing protein [Bacteroidales bacterium]|nr:TaqI-like C-terminal specificity domain-containing protein [Bacteroidales bacterium]